MKSLFRLIQAFVCCAAGFLLTSCAFEGGPYETNTAYEGSTGYPFETHSVFDPHPGFRENSRDHRDDKDDRDEVVRNTINLGASVYTRIGRTIAALS